MPVVVKYLKTKEGRIMSYVSEELVKEFFELNGFLVWRSRQYSMLKKERGQMEEVDLWVSRILPVKSGKPSSFSLGVDDLPHLRRAVIKVCGWHTDRFSPSLLNLASHIFNFVQPGSLERARQLWKSKEFSKILAISALPKTNSLRKESIKILKTKGIDHILEFDRVLIFLIEAVKENKLYYNDLLELLRILKQYNLLKSPQLNLFSRG